MHKVMRIEGKEYRLELVTRVPRKDKSGKNGYFLSTPWRHTFIDVYKCVAPGMSVPMYVGIIDEHVGTMLPDPELALEKAWAEMQSKRNRAIDKKCALCDVHSY